MTLISKCKGLVFQANRNAEHTDVSWFSGAIKYKICTFKTYRVRLVEIDFYMKIVYLSVFILFLQLTAVDCLAQYPTLAIPRNFQHAYLSGTRAADGNPGAAYWQNRADYSLKISFDPHTLLLKGEETIVYANNSPDMLNRLVIHLFPNLFQRGIMRDYPVNEADENEGVTIEKLVIGKQSFTIPDDPRITFSGTNLFVNPAESLMPGSKTTLQISWHYTVNKGSHVRTGQVDSTSFFLAYVFPRIAVYDDVDGWDNWSYSGLQEFYNDFGNFDAEISVPDGYMVWATGTLQNAAAVFSPVIYDRFRKASSGDQLVQIIDSTDYHTGHIMKPGVSWKFSATDVTDFAFAISNHYLWQGSSVMVDSVTGRRVLVDAAYDRHSPDFFEVADVARRCVEIMSFQYPAYPFPYPHITVFQGLDQMEYPMMVNDNVSYTRKDMVQLTSHEIMHTYFPFYMGINETKYAWMDEGWATIGESVISPLLGEPEDDGIYMRKPYEGIAGTDVEVPLITNTKLLTGNTYLINAYGKPGIFYAELQDLLGDQLFFKTLHAYMDRWHGKHPTPFDFFCTFNQVSGQNLDWFFKPWFFENAFPDLGLKVTPMNKSKKSTANSYQITIEKVGALPVAINLQIILENDSIITRHFPASVWKSGNKEFSFTIQEKKAVKYFELGSPFIPDVNYDNNYATPQQHTTE